MPTWIFRHTVVLLHHHDCFGFNIKFLFYLFIFHIGCNEVFICFFLLSLEMAASSFHIEQPHDNGMFSRICICSLVLAVLGGIMLTGID